MSTAATPGMSPQATLLSTTMPFGMTRRPRSSRTPRCDTMCLLKRKSELDLRLTPAHKTQVYSATRQTATSATNGYRTTPAMSDPYRYSK